MRGANCNTDHIMIRTQARFKLRCKIKIKNHPPKKLDVNGLKRQNVREELVNALNERLAEPTGNVNSDWLSFKETVYETSKECHENWFDENCEEIKQLINQRNAARSSMLFRNTRSIKAKYAKANSKLQSRCRELKNSWWMAKAAELQILADTNDMKGFYGNMRAVWGPNVSHPDQLLASDNSTLLTDKCELLKRWYFKTLLNKMSDIDERAIINLEQFPTQHWMDRCPDSDEICKAVLMLQDGKSAGSDGIYPEIIKRGGQKLLSTLCTIIQSAWTTATVPQDWKDAQLVTIFKKGDRRLCSNYRGISLLSVPGKVFARVLLNRLTAHAETLLPEA